MPLNDDSELTDRLDFLGPNTEQSKLSSVLDSANRQMISYVGRDIEEKLRPTVEDQRTFQLAFNQVQDVRQVELQTHRNGQPEVVDAANYTVTKSPAEIEFDQGWAESNLYGNDYRLRVFYVPSLFKEVELMLALEEVMNLSSIQTGDEEKQVMFERYQSRRQELVRSINRTAHNISDPDAGDTLAANFNFPGDRI